MASASSQRERASEKRPLAARSSALCARCGGGGGERGERGWGCVVRRKRERRAAMWWVAGVRPGRVRDRVAAGGARQLGQRRQGAAVRQASMQRRGIGSHQRGVVGAPPARCLQPGAQLMVSRPSPALRPHPTQSSKLGAHPRHLPLALRAHPQPVYAVRRRASGGRPLVQLRRSAVLAQTHVHVGGTQQRLWEHRILVKRRLRST
jgi:hypothetical protein